MTILEPPRPPAPPAGKWGGGPDLAAVTPPDGRVFAVVAVAAVATDLAIRSGGAGLAGGLLAAVLSAGALASGRVPNRRAWPLLGLSPLFGFWLALRTSAWLLPLDVMAAAALLALGASLSRHGDPTDLSIPELCGRAALALAHAALGPWFLLTGLSGRRRGTGRAEGAAPSGTAALARGALLAAPLICLLGLLLASADPLFASFFRLPQDGADVLFHVVFLALGGLGAAALLRTASAVPWEMAAPARRLFGAVETSTVLGAMVALFAAFTAVQLMAVLRGAEYVARTAGLSYAAYARTGFFQLLAVASITLAVLLALRASTDLQGRTAGRRFLVLSQAAVVLTLVIVAGAVRRLWLYEQAYGLTMLRLCSLLFALWIGAVFVLLGVSLAGAGSRRSWLAPAALALALAGLLVANAANLEAIVVRRNVERFGASTKLDIAYLLGLSDDAVPELVRSLPRLEPLQSSVVREVLCAGRRQGAGGFWSYNASRRAAAEARVDACRGGASPPVL